MFSYQWSQIKLQTVNDTPEGNTSSDHGDRLKKVATDTMLEALLG